MNKNHMHQIFSHYIDRFDMINDHEHEEYYKWQVCFKFKTLMDEALSSETSKFADALYKVSKCSENIIDSYTQPFYGLVQYAREEPETVRQMFKDLYSDDGGDVHVQMKLIKNFFDKSNELLERYYPTSHLYKQNSHSVSAYLFLYDPDHHYMYKATQSSAIADCIEFYDDWGNGDNIKLDVYYRMCDQILAEIKECTELLEIHKSRYERDMILESGSLHDDPELHILLFDIIYCSNVYNLFDGITFSRPKSKEKKLLIENQEKAKELLQKYVRAKAEADELSEAKRYFRTSFEHAGIVQHKKEGACKVISANDKYIFLKVEKTGEEKQLDISIVVTNEIIWLNTDEFKEMREKYLLVLKKERSILSALSYVERELKPYEDYLEEM